MNVKSVQSIRMYGLIYLIILSIMLAGCTSNLPQQTNTNDSIEKQDTSNKEQLSLDLKALKDENAVLKERLAVLENSDLSSFYDSDYVNEMYTNWRNEYPHLEILTEPQEWDSIELSSDYGEVVIADPKLIDYANYLFILEPSDESYPGGHYPHDIEPFNITLTNSSGSYQLRTSAQNYVKFEDDYYLFEVSSEVANLGRALLPRPTYLPEESLESRLINSGGVIFSYDEDSYYYDFYQSKQRSITKMFLESEKGLISEDEVKNTNFVVDIIYLLHGEQVLMRVFEGYVLISDNEGEMYWYKTDADLAASINAIINAG